MKNLPKRIHPKGEKTASKKVQLRNKVSVDTYRGHVQIEWDHSTPMTPFGQLAFFIEFLKRTELFDQFVESCPLVLTSNNAPSKRDILGTILLSVLAGHWRYTHITAVQTDKVNPQLLGMNKIVSEDSVRRGLKKIAKDKGETWLLSELSKCYSEILTKSWILDVDTTVKCLYGHQEGAVVGYNPIKPGRPSHVYHTYMIANIRMALDVEIMAGNESTSKHTLPSLVSFLETLEPEERPYCIRGDCNFGTDAVMNACEERKFKYLFKLKQTPNVKRFISEKMVQGDWCYAGQGWEGADGKLQLLGWEKARRVIVLRRRVKKEVGVVHKKKSTGQQLVFQFASIGDDIDAYEYAVLVTNLDIEVLSIAAHYRDRADCENNFDELKNQWGWAGFTTHDLHRCQLMARIIALVYNWWTLFVRLIAPEKHLEAITSRPLLLNAVGKQIKHGRQTIIQVNSNHGKFPMVQFALAELSAFFKTLKSSAEQLSVKEKLHRVIERAFKKFLASTSKDPPKMLPALT